MRKVWLFLIVFGVLLGLTGVAEETKCLMEAFFVSPTVDHVIQRKLNAQCL